MASGARENGDHAMSIEGFVCAPLPVDEAERLRALRRYGVLDSDPELRFDRLTSLTRRLMGTPMALVSLVDVDRQFFLSRQGLDATQTSRQVAFCAHAILADDILEVSDATRDPRFAGNPLVVGPPHLRYYAGKPLRTPDGYRLGTLCALDTCPHAPMSAEQRHMLSDLAATVMELIETRVWALEAESERQLAIRMGVLKDEYLASMAHELRTPVNAMTGFGELLRMTGAPDVLSDNQKGYLDNIVEASEYLALLVNQTLEAHTPADGDGSAPVKIAPVALTPVLTSVGRLLTPLARKQGVTLTVADAGDLTAWGDPVRVRQVFINLMSNALKYNKRGGTVSVDLEADCEWLSIVCRDTGKGIPEDEIPKLFSAFHRVAENSPGVEGTGLGLRITDRLVRMMGGQLSVDSTVGVGTTFTVTFARAT